MLVGGPFYFRSTNSYSMPVQPSGQISEEEAKELGASGSSYGIAYFHSDGRIREFTKYHREKVVLHVDYVYRKDMSLKETKEMSFFFVDNENKILVKKTAVSRCFVGKRNKMIKMLQVNQGEGGSEEISEMLFIEGSGLVTRELNSEERDNWNCDE